MFRAVSPFWFCWRDLGAACGRTTGFLYVANGSAFALRMIFGGCPPEFGVGVPLGVMPAGEALMITSDVGVAPGQLSKGRKDAQEALMRRR